MVMGVSLEDILRLKTGHRIAETHINEMSPIYNGFQER